MHRIGILAALCLAPVVVSSATPDLSVEEVIARHVEARGGGNWDKIRTMRAVGDVTTFSEVAPFTLTKKRDDRYLLDHAQNAKKVIIGHDGQISWWENHWFEPRAKPLAGADLAALSPEFSFVNSLFDYKAKNYTAELIGETEYEGTPAIGVKLTRPDQSVETWYLDPRTYLEFARVSPGSDFGRPTEQRTFFDEFRTVEGVKIPFYTETQWYTRERVLRIEKVEFNVEVDDAIFAMPAPPGMGPLLSLAGEWKIAVEGRPWIDADFAPSESSGTIETRLERALVRSEIRTAEGATVLWDLAYDTARSRYRMTTINTDQAYIDVLEGTSNESGRIMLSNLDTGTTLETFGMSLHTRASIFDVTPDGFKMEYEISSDGGATWAVLERQTFARAQGG